MGKAAGCGPVVPNSLLDAAIVRQEKNLFGLQAVDLDIGPIAERLCLAFL